MTTVNRRTMLAHAIEGVPQDADFKVAEMSLPEPAAGELQLRHIYLSLDPWQRSAIAGRHSPDGTPMQAGDMPPGEVVAQVAQSRHADFAEGDYVRHMGGWQEYSIADGNLAVKVDAPKAPLSAYLGVLGMPGLTAWASIIKLADIQPGQTVLVSAALGPVGATLGQIALKMGASAVVGIAGSAEKCRYVIEECGFSQCVNYKSPDYLESLQNALPDGADIYHDNVGGQMLIDAIGVMKQYGTVVLCGLISQYNDPALAVNLPVALPIMKRLVMKGLVVYDFYNQQQEFFDLVAPWVNDGSISFREDRAAGIENAGAHFAKLMCGDNVGKSLIVLGDE